MKEMKWQPIETSPKDGTTVLAWRKHAGIPFFIRYNYQYEWFEDDNRNHVYDLTHWMPLPPPPEDI